MVNYKISPEDAERLHRRNLQKLRSRLRSKSHDVSRIFWPVDGIPDTRPGFLIGWHVDSLVCCVGGVVLFEDMYTETEMSGCPADSFESVSECLRQLASDPGHLELWEHCSGPPTVLGIWLTGDSTSEPTFTPADSLDYWVVMHGHSHSGLPSVANIFSSGTPTCTAAQIVFYHRPQPGTFVSSKPFTFEPRLPDDQPQIDINLSDFDYVMHQINVSTTFICTLRDLLRPIKPEPTSMETGPSFSVRFFKRSMYQAFGFPALCILLVLRVLCGVLLRIVNWPLPYIDIPLCKFSALCLQVDKRLSELCRWPHMWKRTLTDIHDSVSVVTFWCSVWQVVVDIALGVALGWCMRAYSTECVMLFHKLGKYLHMDVMRQYILWLMKENPAGLKLNNNLSHCFGSMTLFGMDFWESISTIASTWETTVVWVLSLAGFFGASMIIALFTDLISILTVHIRFVHTISGKIFRLELAALSTLWKLFRGKKQNVLKQRIDSCDFDVDQLMVGTVIFALIFLILPTVTVYYAFFTSARLLLSLFGASLWIFIFFFNYFPFCALVMRVVEGVSCGKAGGSRLPGGVYLDMRPPETNVWSRNVTPSHDSQFSGDTTPTRRTNKFRSSDSPSRSLSGYSPSSLKQFEPGSVASFDSPRSGEPISCTYIDLRCSRIALGSLFAAYKRELSNVFREYSPKRIVCSLLFGRPFTHPSPLKKHRTSQEMNGIKVESFRGEINRFWTFLLQL
eukprot:822968_1